VDLITLPLQVSPEQGQQILLVFYDKYPDAHGEDPIEGESGSPLFATRFTALPSRSPSYEVFSQARGEPRCAQKTLLPIDSIGQRESADKGGSLAGSGSFFDDYQS
jgi:hypothetical protein